MCALTSSGLDDVSDIVTYILFFFFIYIFLWWRGAGRGGVRWVFWGEASTSQIP